MDKLRTTNEPVYVIRTLKLMNWLCHRGFTVIKVLDSTKDPRFKIFLFRDTEKLRTAVDGYLNEIGV